MIEHPKYTRGNIYLSGGMQHADNLGGGWRSVTSLALKEMGYFPLDITELDIAYTAKHGELYRSFGSDPNDHLQMKSNIRKHFVTTDLALIDNDSDALIVYYDESVRLGAGTISECQHAYNLNLPIFIVCAYENWNEEMPGWLQSLSTTIFSTFDDLYSYLDALPVNILKRDKYGNHCVGNQYLCSLCGNPFIKNKHHYVSTIAPLYCAPCVDIVTTTFEEHADRYDFFVNYFKELS